MIRGRIFIGVAVVISLFALSGPVCGQLFENRITYPGLYAPKGIAAADFNSDGRIDLAVANQGNVSNLNDSIAVILNLGGGVFGPQIALRTGEGPYAVCAADLNGDGVPDLVAANRSGTTVTVLINDGHADFTNTSSPTVGSLPTDVHAADLDLDGDLDLVVSNIITTNVSVLMNMGDGNFYPKADYPISDAGNAVFPGDLNGDHYPDLAAAGPFGVDLLMNGGDGRFHPVGQIGSGTSRNYINGADFDGDGDIDLVTTDLIQSRLSIFMNNGDGTFSDPVGITIPDWGDQVIPADFDNDGDIDLAASLNFTGQLIVLLNDGAGNFTIENVYDAGDRSVGLCAADINDDGDLDVAIVNGLSDDISVFVNTLYAARAMIEPDTVKYDADYAVEIQDGYMIVGNFDPPYGPSDIDPASVRIDGSLIPSSMEIVNGLPDFDGEAIKYMFDLQDFVTGSGAAWGIDSYQYSVSGDFTNGAPFVSSGKVVMYGILPGDANGDGAINVGDPVVIISYLFRDGPLPAIPEAADVDGADGIALADALILINYIFRDGVLPAMRR